MAKKMRHHHKEMLRIRGYNPNNYELVKNTYTSVYFRDIRTGKILPILKYVCR